MSGAMIRRKAVADLRSAPARTLLVVLALAVGIVGAGGMLVSYTILTHDLRENFVATRPAHAVLTSGDFDKLDLATLRQREDIESAEYRDLSLQRIEARPGDWIPLWLFGVADFAHPLAATTRSESGARTPPPGTMLLERDGRLISDLKVGSRARVRVGRRSLDVPVSGIVFDPAQAPATQDHFIYAYVDTATYARLTGERTQQRLLLRMRHAKNTADVQRVVDRVVAVMAKSGVRVSTAKVPAFNEHPHQWQLNTLLSLQGSIGLLALVMAAVLIAELMASIMAKQVREIGVMRAIGASRRQVLSIYVTMVLMIGVAAGIVAIPLALQSGSAFAHFVSTKLNFDVLTHVLPLPVYAILVAVSILLPVIVSLPALLGGLRVPVREALGDYGIRVDTQGRVPFRVFTARLSPFWQLAARNTLRQPRRFALTVVTTALGVAIFSTGFNVRASLAGLLIDVKASLRHDVQVVLNEQVPRERALAPFRGLQRVARAETWNGGRGELQSMLMATTSGVGVVAVPRGSTLFTPRVVAGRWLATRAVPEIVMNQQALDLYRHPALGSRQTLALHGATLEVTLVGVVQDLERAKIYVDQQVYDAAANPAHDVNSVMFVASDQSADAVGALKRDIEAALAPSDLSVLYVMSQAERVKVIYDHLNIILSALIILSFSVLMVSSLGMASTTGVSILERTREIGVMRAIGATPAMVYRLFVVEGMIASVASVGLGLLLAWPLSLAACSTFGTLMLGQGASLRYTFSVQGLAVTLVTTLVFGWSASRGPARRAVSVTTRDALAYS